MTDSLFTLPPQPLPRLEQARRAYEAALAVMDACEKAQEELGLAIPKQARQELEWADVELHAAELEAAEREALGR